MKKHYYTDEILDICNKKHLTADEVYSELKRKYASVWISSVYRNLEDLAKKWKLRKILWVGKKAYFEKNIGYHIHLIDTKTEKIYDIDIKDLSCIGIPYDFDADDIDIRVFWTFSH